MTNAVESATKDLRDYLASAGDKPDAGIVRALTGAIERSAAKAPEPVGIDPANTKPAATLERTTEQFLRDEENAEAKRRADAETAAIKAMGVFDREAFEADLKRDFGRAQIGNLNGPTSITGEKP
jgi:hypothetical protein